MKKIIFSLFIIIVFPKAYSQNVTATLGQLYKTFENDPQLRSAISSLYVVDAVTGKVIFDKNSGVGLAPASTLKTVTSATAFDILGKNFNYTTELGYYGNIEHNILSGSIYIKPSGDPTLGSWRWPQTKEDNVMNELIGAIKNIGIKKYNSIIIDGTGWEGETIPGGWIWEDIGNYYGAGADILNWRENQYDLVLESGKAIGDPVIVKETKPRLYSYSIQSFAKSAAKGTGDRAYIYFPLNASGGIVRGTIPIDEKNFTISGAMPSAKNQFIATLSDSLSNAGIHNLLQYITIDTLRSGNINSNDITGIHTITSPPLDSIIYWFMRRSVNLYGEALAKTIAHKNNKAATTSNGTTTIKEYWKSRNIGLDISELNLHDGSGLSPLNRITTHAQVHILQYAKRQPWFQSFYQSFPEFNGMKMKSGTINGVKGFTGYHTARNGKQYIYSFVVNNYNGSSSTLVQKMYKVLDVLK